MTGFFTGGGASLSFGNPQDPSAFPQFGNRWRGGQIIEEGTVGPQTDINTGAVLTDGNNRVKEQLALPLLCDGSGPAAQAGMRTDERNAEDHTDTGRRVAYIKGSLRYAVGDALRAAGTKDLEVGGYLFLMWTGMGKTGNSKFIGRTWQVHYIRPTGAFLSSASPQSAAPPAQGAMPVQQNAAGQYAPHHTGFAPTAQPVTAPPQQGWAPAPSAPVAPPNPYGGAGSGQFRPDDNGWMAEQAPPSVQQHYAPTQQPGGAFPPAAPQWQQGDAQHAPVTPSPSPAAPSNPWGAAPETPQPPQAPYGPPQGTPAPPAAGNPWQQ